MSTTCLICYEQNQIWVLPPCNHQNVCWKCCLKLVEGSIFSCPFCQSKPQCKSQLLFVTTEEMSILKYQTIMESNPFRSYKNTIYFYSSQQVAHYMQAQTSHHCVRCGQVHESLNLLKKHLYDDHRVQFCEVCLDNRRCITTEQPLFIDYELQRHLKQGDLSTTGEVILYHPLCQFCNRRFYDLEAFKLHLKMSSHLKCQVCEINCSHKYVYYRNFHDLEAHHNKTHFVCDLGDCASKKLENVFVSEMLREDHKHRFHRKHRSDKKEKTDNNIMVCFNKKEDEEMIEFDGIGRDFARQFAIFDTHQVVQKEQHSDQPIDLRQFYPQQLKMTLRVRTEDIIDKLNSLHEVYGRKQRDPEFSQIPIYKPLIMSTLYRSQCERFLRRCLAGRQADGIIDIFFNKRMDYRCAQDWFQNLQKKLRTISSYSFYLIFPQLVRNLRETNKNKVPMDKFYSRKLHSLPLTRMFIFHELRLYSELFDYIKHSIEDQISSRLENKQVDLEIYAHFLKAMNNNFYIEQQEGIYWVSREKITHLYHMVEHCSTKDLLKMNWLLKVGLSNATYELLQRFFYKTSKENTQRPFSSISLQELSLIKSYLTICIQAMLDHSSFSISKQHPGAHYLTNAIEELPQYPSVSSRQINQLRVLEGHSNAIVQKSSIHPLKGMMIDDKECPSLLRPIDITEEATKKKTQQQPDILRPGNSLPSQWNEERASKKKKFNLQTVEKTDEFPALFGSAQKQKAPIEEDNEEFPVFNFKDKFVKVQEEKESQNTNFSHFVGFNKKTIHHSYWDEDKTRNNIIEAPTPKLIEAPKQKIIQTSVTPQEKKNHSKMSSLNEDKELKMALAQSLKTAKVEDSNRSQLKVEVLENIIPKKHKDVVGEPRYKPGKNKNNKTLQPSTTTTSKVNPTKKIEEKPNLFERIENEQKEAKKKPFRLDLSEEKRQSPKQEKILKKEKVLTNCNRPIFIDDDFAPLSSTPSQQDSIVTRIMKESQASEQIMPQPRRPRNKRRKRVDESP